MDIVMDAQAYFDRREYRKVIAMLKNANSANDLELKALSLQKSGSHEEAMLVWNILIKKLPEVASFYNERGVCKFNLRFPHAVEDFDKAIKLDGNNPYFYASRAYIKDKLGDSEGAVEDYQRAHDLDPDDAVTLNNLGLAEQKLGHTSKAREFFRKSNDLLGITTADAEEPEVKPASKPGLRDQLKEVGKMLSSLKEFKRFLKELFKK